MKINEIILEHPVDEGLGQAIGKAWGGTMKGVGATAGGLAGSWDAMKQGYRAGKAAVSGRSNPDDDGNSYVWNGSAWVDEKTGAPSPDQSVPPPAEWPRPPHRASSRRASAAAMKSADIVKDLDDVWNKVTADQGSQTSSPKVQQKIIAMAKAAGLAGQIIKENKVGFHSRFLNMEI